MSRIETQFERLEFKYLVDEDCASVIRHFIRPYCAEDIHNPARRSGDAHPLGYEIRTLYLDSPSLSFHRSRERGDPERLKLRARSYRNTDVVALEIKRRFSDTIRKSRVAIHAKHLEECTSGLAEPLVAEPESRAELDRFAMLATSALAEPTLLIRYRREAWASAVDDYARITFDRDIAAQRVRSWDLEGDPNRWCRFDDHWIEGGAEPPIVLEIKCQTVVPHWVADLIRSQHLVRRNFSKYSIGIHLTGCESGVADLALRSSRNSGLSFGAAHGIA